MADTPEALAEKVRQWANLDLTRPGSVPGERRPKIAAMLDELESRAKETLTPEEARIVLIGLDAIQEYGWTGAPYTNVLQSAIDKLESLAGDLEQATVHPLQQTLNAGQTEAEATPPTQEKDKSN